MRSTGLRLLIFFIFLPLFGFGQGKYALLIGINQYAPPADYKVEASNGRIDFPNLEGCRNDVASVKSLLRSKFSFDERYIDTLYDKNATRDHILTAFNDLLNKAKKGDIVFIYYAGHGSQVYNSKSKEEDKKDETIVPADAWKEGVEDIRDKELARKFNEFLDKGIKLTVILDCCHSGSMSRGGPILRRGKLRFIPGKNKEIYDANDDSDIPLPANHKGGSFLLLSAAQDNEFAEEMPDDNDPPQSQGAFTVALITALNQQSVDAAALDIFISTRAILKSNGKKQEPVIASTAERGQQSIFGIAKGILPDRIEVAVAGFSGEEVVLQGGFALGIYKENELMKVKGSDTMMLRVDSVLGVNKSWASVKKGNIAAIASGELFWVSNWASPQAPLIKLYIPKGNYSNEQLSKLVQIDNQLRIARKSDWMNDLEKKDPYTNIYFDNNKCYIGIDGSEPKEAVHYSTSTILDQCKKNAAFYFELPSSNELLSEIAARVKNNRSVILVDKAEGANYILYGTIDAKGNPAYGLRKSQTSSRDSLESMPIQTKNFSLLNYSKDAAASVADSIFEYALRLAKIRGWLQLPAPKSTVKSLPYHLEIWNGDSNKPITDSRYKMGDSIVLHFVANEDYRRYPGGLKYVYLFIIDKDGSMQLIYPDLEGNEDNRFPKQTGEEIIKDFEAFGTIVRAPTGTDNYYLLATAEQIPDYARIFRQAGVRGINPITAFGNLLSLGNINSRRPVTLPDNWSLQHVSFKCTY